MADKSKIEWCDATWNVAYGCSKVSAGCKNCYAHRMISTRFPHLTGHGDQSDTDDYNGWDGLAHFKPERLEIPFHWRKPRRIFVCSMSDLFHESLTDEQIAAVFGVMAATPQHQYVVLTRRLQRAMEWLLFEWIDKEWFADNCVPVRQLNRWDDTIPWPLPNVIMCASVEDQKTADERVPLLLQIPARWRGVVVEPMLGPARIDGVDVGKYRINAFACGECGYTMHDVAIQMDHRLCRGEGPGIHLVICGAETGPGKRPFKDEWALDLRDQCKAAGTPFFFKKDGAGKPALCGVEYHEWII